MAELLPLPAPPTAADPLWRHLVGERLRRMRHERGETLAVVARRAGVSVQYLSEVERGRKEPSSEIVAAILTALDGTLLDLTAGIADDLRAAEHMSARPLVSSPGFAGMAVPAGVAGPAGMVAVSAVSAPFVLAA